MARRRWQTFTRTEGAHHLGWLVVVTLLLTAVIVSFPEYVPLLVLVVPLVLSSILLGPRQLPWFVVFVLLFLVVALTKQPDFNVRVVIGVIVIFGLGLIVLLGSFRRSRLGVAGLMGESMFVDLRDRILKQGRIPTLPSDWYVSSELRSAGGTAFAGDFVVASRSASGARLEIAVVDVSGKGEQAGTRALLLSGAFGGLMGALPSEEFLPAANTYLLRQEWDEGFASAIHFSLDLVSGDFVVWSAGHPPAVRRSAGTGKWSVLPSSGPLLGLIDDAEFEPVTGSMSRGDAIMLYTDGLVETRGRDISSGIDKMIGQAERVLRGDFRDGAARLIDTLGSADDDRALLLVQRR
ncbi:PP2C family protein-serine/threonine phosphatase [Nocardioides sp. InS609-2]|uniref:PP2C family protein-serine/threonine phosphatase n=1 Tax=Nocardioides sp. InS609-2 TaxID=2760705 RepID=UPI0020BD7AB1|nr:PP2C family protein-serine/threonine phosphatase [Nocardioides sp. InS609-2]